MNLVCSQALPARVSRTSCRCAVLFLLQLFTAELNAQFRMLYEKQIQYVDDFQFPENITGISDIDGGKLILFTVRDDGAALPAFAFLDRNDRLWPAKFLNIDSLKNVVLLGASRNNDREVLLMGNDYTDRQNGAPVPMPFEVTLGKGVNDTVFTLTSLGLTRVTDVADTRSFSVTGNAGDGANGQYLGIVKRDTRDRYRAYYYALLPDAPAKNIQFEESDFVRSWYAGPARSVMSTESRLDSNRRVYRIHVLDHDLKEIRTYPDKDLATVRALLGTTARDRLVRVVYRPVQELGFVTRQVRDNSGRNRIGFYTFNGLATPNPVFNQVGIEGDVQAASGPVIPDKRTGGERWRTGERWFAGQSPGNLRWFSPTRLPP